MNHALFSVSGMTCAACSSSISEALQNLPSVSSAAVSLLTNEAKVTYSSEIPWQTLLDAIEGCGFDASLISITPQSPQSQVTIVNISGMTCAACSSSITEALESISGVQSAAVSLLTNSAKICHSDSVSASSLLAAIEDCGFDAVLDSSSPSHSASGSATVESVFEVYGMTCGACSASITEAVESLPDVVSASVSQLTNSAMVRHHERLTGPEIVTCIEDCGFEARFVSTKKDAQTLAAEIEDVTLRISGVNEDTDFHALHYNIEATLKSLPGIEAFQTLWKGEVDADELQKNTSDLDPESLEDQLRLSINTSVVGVRQVVDALNSRDDAYSFDVLNAVDQSLNSQMKLLSKEKDIQYWRSNFYGSVFLGLPVIVLSLVDDTDFWKSMRVLPGLYVVSVIQLILATLILVFLGSIFFRKFGVFIRNRGRNANMDVLVCISTSVSYVFSLLSIFLSVWTGQTKRPPKVLFDTVAMLIGFISFGKWIENKAKGATSSALSKLISLTPTTCEILTQEWHADEKDAMAADLHTRVIPIDLIQKGDIAVVSAGAKIPADGHIIQGTTEIDESIITGESLPVFKDVGDPVIGGSINGPFLIYMRVSSAGKNSQLHRIINVVKDSQVNKAPVQRFADYIAARFVIFVLTLSLSTLIFWLVCSGYFPSKLPNMFLKEENGKYYVCLKLAISVIVVACPCALGLAAPTAVMVGTGVGATHGALIKGGDVLEKANSINIVLFDKTGTLTKGNLQIVRTKMCGKLHESDWWTLVASVEVNSEHPTGRAIAKHAKSELGLGFDQDTLSTTISDFQVLSGLGVSAQVWHNGTTHHVVVGNKKLIVRDFKEARMSLAEAEANELVGSFASVSHVVIDGQYCGYMELSDSVKSCTRDTIQYLQKIEHYQVGMVTGDNSRVATKIGRELGIPEGNIFSEVSPIEKDAVVADLRRRFGGNRNVSIAFVGDGINDAPALVQADIGMAISSGTDIAIDSAEIVLMGSHGKTNDLYGVVTALQISQASFQKIKWNFLGATIYNMFMLPFAMGCFLKFGLSLSPVTAAAAMACSSLTVVLNSLTLKSWRPPNIREAVEMTNSEWAPDFSLKHSTLEEFNAIKRGKFRWFKRRLFSRRKSTRGNYELIQA